MTNTISLFNASTMTSRTLSDYGLSHDGGSVCSAEAASVIKHLDTMLEEAKKLMLKATRVGVENMSVEAQAEWYGMAEGWLMHSKYLLTNQVEPVSEPMTNFENNIVSLSAKLLKKKETALGE